MARWSAPTRRPLVTGAVSEREAKALFVVLMLLALVLVLFTNTLTVSCPCRRGTGLRLPLHEALHPSATSGAGRCIFLGYSHGVCRPAQCPAPALWLLYLGNLLWTVAYDTKYAMVDREHDLKIGIKSSAILFGRHDRLIIGVLQLACLLCLYLAGQSFNLGLYYNASLVVAALLFGYHHYLIRERGRQAASRPSSTTIG